MIGQFSNSPYGRVIGLTAALALAGCAEAPAPPQPPTVTVATPVVRDVPRYAEFPGTSQAFESVEVRARVSGELEEINFEPSSPVRKGDILFRIEKTLYDAAHTEAEAALRSAEADLARAESDLERIRKAIQSEAVSEQELDRAVAGRDMAESAVLSAEGNLSRAALNLSYTDVKSPISGLVGRNRVDVGNLVGAGEPTLLTTVRNVDPMYVYFQVPEVALLNLLHILREAGFDLNNPRSNRVAGSSPDTTSVVKVSVAVSTDIGFPHKGYIDYIDNTVDPGTGTIQIRAVIPNEELLLFPGLFMRVRVEAGVDEGALTIDEKAISTDIGGKFVYVVDADNIVEQRYLELGRRDDSGFVSVVSGIEANERYIVNGILKARPGLPVTPTTEEVADEMPEVGDSVSED